ncbi:sensor domain-containing protein [Halosimplex pelagicum]|uniref:Sensor domain-containing protein n=1 Tax=Halosimplex pelagicum TaxID=869886 RepID=A0A7D5PD20_9EURY|nr:sensor domain-containing protein [Halosimplex pelagicum]QLH82898.1 sensor domain-containing protein [Halosimplex pelagicum]
MSRLVSALRAPDGPGALLRRFLGVPLRLQTYANLLYLSALFPLGITYSVVLPLGFGLGIGLSVILVGLPLFVATLLGVRELTALERYAADRLLVGDVPAGGDAPPLSEPVAHLKHALTSLSTWKGVAFLLSKVLVGTAAFTLLIVLGTLSLSLLLVPLYYRSVNVGVRPVSGEMNVAPSVEFALQTWEIGLTIPFRLTTWYVTTLPEALAVSAFGLVATLVSLHVCNFAARAAGWYASLLVGGTDRSALRRFVDA